ncbi:MAG: MFS transporter [SAR324 cluster bacterium]|nr:MFS transporter [SAR324 cluster bacterium]
MSQKVNVPPLKLRRARWAVTLIFMANGTSFASIVPHFPWLQRKLELTEATMGFALLLPAIGAIAMMLTTARLIQRFGSRILTVLGCLLLLSAVPVVTVVPTMALMTPFLLAVGMGNGMMDVSMNAQAAAVEQGYGRPLMSSFHAAFSLGTLLGGGIASVVLGWDVTPLQHTGSIVVVLAVLVLACGGFLLTPAEDVPGEQASVISIPKGPVLALGLLAVLGMMAEGVSVDWSAIYVRNTLNASAQVAALTFTVFCLTMTLSRLVGDRLVARFGPALVLRCSAFIGASGLAVGLGLGTPEAAMLGFGCMGLGVANTVPILFSAASRLPGVAAGTGIAGVSTLGYGGFLFGPPLIGLTAEGIGLRLALGLLVLFCLTIAVFAPRLISNSER